MLNFGSKFINTVDTDAVVDASTLHLRRGTNSSFRHECVQRILFHLSDHFWYGIYSLIFLHDHADSLHWGDVIMYVLDLPFLGIESRTEITPELMYVKHDRWWIYITVLSPWNIKTWK